MLYEIPYGQQAIGIEIPGSLAVAVLEPGKLPKASGASIQQALANPFDSPSFGAFLEGSHSVLVIINDATRPTPTRLVLDEIADSLAAFSPRFLIATGAHRAPTEAEYRQIFGVHYDRFRNSTTAHDARDPSSLADLGQTRNGTPILLNKAIFEADRIIIIGSVEPHYFAGYTGGRKAFLPGIAGYATIEANHRLALSPMARALELERNPVSQDMDDALTHLHVPIFSIMTVLDKDQAIAWCSAGDIRSSFNDAVVKANAIFTVPIDGLFDIVISAARYPMDIDLYQSQKAIDNGSLALKDGGTLIMVSTCRDGIGDKAFLELMASADSPAAVLAKIQTCYRLGYHKAAKIALTAGRASIIAYTDLPPSEARKAFLQPCGDLQEAVDSAIQQHGSSARICIIPDGTVTVPLLSS
ncbi:MAG: nickel-dependent lactate racemase [Spirochaetaceae bacterium]|nr:nickel-dependent lactate racemase [Spirochaetaceae bacterium]